MSDSRWCKEWARLYETYLDGDNPRAQSGFGGDEARWEAARRPIVEAIDADGTFLDIGCASGYLMESVARWSRHRIEPYGLDLLPALADLARRRLPQWADRIFVGDALAWEPPMRFDFVRTELVYVPGDRMEAYVLRLLGEVVEPGGRLIVCGYGSGRSGMPAHPVRRLLRSWSLEHELELAVEDPEGGGLITELAALRSTPP